MAEVLLETDTYDVHIDPPQSPDVVIGEPMDKGGIISITENGKHVVSGYDLAEVDVQTYVPPFTNSLGRGGALMQLSFSRSQYAGDLDLRGLDVSSVTNMSQMFLYCQSLQSLDVSEFDTSKVTNMWAMFCGCNKLQTIDVSRFDTSKVTNMSQMFYQCFQLRSLDVSGFDTGKVTLMYDMFNNCNKLQTIDVSRFDTSKVTNMLTMFSSCTSLQSLDLTGWNVSGVINATNMFAGCTQLITLVGSRSLDEIKRNNIGAMNGARIDYSVSYCPLDVASLVALFNGVADLTGQASKTITVGKTNLAKLTPEQIAIATNKNWNVA